MLPDVTADGHLSFNFVVFSPASFFYVVLFQSRLDQPKLFSGWVRNKNIFIVKWRKLYINQTRSRDPSWLLDSPILSQICVF